MKPIRDPQQLSLFRSSRFLTTGEAAALLKVSITKVHSLMEEGALEFFRKGRNGWKSIRYESVIELLDKWAQECFSSRGRE
jgi:excisionase family DNA binding protein